MLNTNIKSKREKFLRIVNKLPSSVGKIFGGAGAGIAGGAVMSAAFFDMIQRHPTAEV